MDYELREQVFSFFDGNASALAVVGKLFAVDAANREVAGIGMRDEQAADGCRGLDAIVVGQSYIQLPFCIQSVEDDALQRMVGTGGITEGNTKKTL